MKDMTVRLSTLWIFALLNYIYADLLTIFDTLFTPGALAAILEGDAAPIPINQWTLLAAAVLMEIAIAMVVLSRALPHAANRWTNIIAGTIQTAAVTASLFMGKPTLYYAFFGIIEIACTLLIIWYAWTWTNPDAAGGSRGEVMSDG